MNVAIYRHGIDEMVRSPKIIMHATNLVLENTVQDKFIIIPD